MDRTVGAREVKLIAIGSSKGILLPEDLLRQYGWSDSIILEEAEDGVFLRGGGREPSKLSWKDTCRAMAAADENWSEWDAAAADGLD